MNEERNIDVDNEVEPPKKLTPDEVKKKKAEEDLIAAYRYNKMNKAAKAKHDAKIEVQKGAEKIKEELARAAERSAKLNRQEAREAAADRRLEKLSTGSMFRERKNGG